MAELTISEIYNAAPGEAVFFDIADATVPPAHLSFFSDKEGEVMRITDKGVFVNPNVSADLAAQIVVAALDQHIKHIVAERDAEIDRLRLELARKEQH